MYAVIRAGGKQYRVAPGDVIRVETAGRQGRTGRVQRRAGGFGRGGQRCACGFGGAA